MRTDRSNRRARYDACTSRGMARLSETIGRAAGWIVGPLFAATTAMRRARTFHPRGDVLRARVEPEVATGTLVDAAERLRGPALVRLSGALFRSDHKVLPDVLGCAIRFRSTPELSPEPAIGDQDLLLATIKRPFTMFFAPLTTHVHDYLANHYFGTSPFDVPGYGKAWLRLRPDPVLARFPRRTERLLAAVWRGEAVLHLEVGRGPRGPWQPLVAILLEGAANVDDRALRFAPHRTGRGIRPRGLVHALRRGVYAASQSAR
jgi:hypothetical protein